MLAALAGVRQLHILSRTLERLSSSQLTDVSQLAGVNTAGSGIISQTWVTADLSASRSVLSNLTCQLASIEKDYVSSNSALLI